MTERDSDLDLGQPQEWFDSSDEQKEAWVGEAKDLLTQEGRVPENSVHSFAVAWDYFRRKGKRKWVRTISNYEGRHGPDDYPAGATAS